MFKELSFDCVYPEFEFTNLLYRTLGKCEDMDAMLMYGLAMAVLVVKNDSIRTFADRLKMEHLERPFMYSSNEPSELYSRTQEELKSCRSLMVLKRGDKIYLFTSHQPGRFDVLVRRLQKLQQASQEVNVAFDDIKSKELATA